MLLNLEVLPSEYGVVVIARWWHLFELVASLRGVWQILSDAKVECNA